ncbi:MAG: hypothetical protein Q8K82_07970 [Gemmatimonadaceae bacterium]|nr:hypothetical protein [Gemmatimonadaceae bacterium]
MIETLLPFFEWCEGTGLGQLVRTSLWLFPVIESVHLLGLSALGGTVLLVDLRMLGTGLTRQSLSSVAAAVHPWLVASVALLMLTGIPLFLSEAVKCFYNPSFWVKMATLPVALLYTFTVRRRVAMNPRRDTSSLTRLVAAVSLLLWFTVAAAGRWIGYSS